MVSAFERAWGLVKALPEQQAFEQMRANHPSDRAHWDIDHANWADMGDGMRSAGTIHPAILGMMQRLQDEKYAEYGGEPGSHKPTTNLEEGGRRDQKVRHGYNSRPSSTMRAMRTKGKTEDEIADMDAESHFAGALAGRDSWPELAEAASLDHTDHDTEQGRHYISHPTRAEEAERADPTGDGESPGYSYREHNTEEKDVPRQIGRDAEMRSNQLMGQHSDHEKNQVPKPSQFRLDADEDNPRMPFR